VIFWVGLGLRLVAIAITHSYRIRDIPVGNFNFGWEMGRIARSLVLGHGYANPFNGVSGPTAWTPPLYPLLMAASFKMFGLYSKGAAIFLLACNSVCSAAIVPAVYEIAARCFDARGIARRASSKAAPVALWSAWMWAVYPAALQYAVHWIWEMSVSTMLFAWILVLALRLRGVGEDEGPGSRIQGSEDGMASSLGAGSGNLRPRFGTWAAFGGLWGLLMLSNASLALCLPAMLVWIAWPWLKARRWSVELKRSAVGAVVACVVCGVVMSPWVVRNWVTLHAFVPTRSNLGVELYESTLESHDAFPWGTAMPLWPGDPEFQRYVRMGEVPYARVRQAEAMARIKTRRMEIARWTMDRFLYFWDGTPHPPEPHPAQEYLRQLSYCFLSVCGLLGLALMLKRRVEGAGLFALVFVLLPLPYYLITVQPRFRAPMEPLIAILAVYLFRSAETGKIWSGALWKRD
jgi:hypothetical protein